MATRDESTSAGLSVSGVTAGRDVVVTLVGGGAGVLAICFVLAALVGLLTYPAPGAALVAVGAFVLSAGLMLSIIHRSNMGQVLSGGLGSFFLVKGHGIGGATLVGLGAAGVAVGGNVAGESARAQLGEAERVGSMHIPSAGDIAERRRKYEDSRPARGVREVDEVVAVEPAREPEAPVVAARTMRAKRPAAPATLVPASSSQTPELVGLAAPRVLRETGYLIVELPGVVVDAGQLEISVRVQFHDLSASGSGPVAVLARSPGKYRGPDGTFVASAHHRVASERMPLSVMKVLVPLAELALPVRPRQQLAATASVFLAGGAGPERLLARAPVASFEVRADRCGPGVTAPDPGCAVPAGP